MIARQNVKYNNEKIIIDFVTDMLKGQFSLQRKVCKRNCWFSIAGICFVTALVNDNNHAALPKFLINNNTPFVINIYSQTIRLQQKYLRPFILI